MGLFTSGRPGDGVPKFHVSVIALLLGLSTTSPLLAAPFDCAHNRCGLLTPGNNRDLVIGTVEAVATPAQMKSVLRWAQAHGYWSSLPADGRGYLSFVQLVSVAVPHASGARSATVLMTREEFASGPLQAGALVRYSPHDAAHDAITYKDPSKQAYWVLVGCVAQLCAKGDTACAARYRSGRFSRKSGRQLNLVSGHPLRHGALIDPQTMLPRAAGR